MNKGFTLIELIIVIAIVGVLGSVSLALSKDARKKAGDTYSDGSYSETREERPNKPFVYFVDEITPNYEICQGFTCYYTERYILNNGCVTFKEVDLFSQKRVICGDINIKQL